MFLILIRRELLDNLMTFRFAAAVVIMLLLVVVNTVVLIKDYEGRLADYNTAVKTHRQELLLENKTYSDGMLSFWGTIIVDRPPNPLSIFNTGLDKRLGNEIRVSHILRRQFGMPTSTRRIIHISISSLQLTSSSFFKGSSACWHSLSPTMLSPENMNMARYAWCYLIPWDVGTSWSPNISGRWYACSCHC